MEPVLFSHKPEEEWNRSIGLQGHSSYLTYPALVELSLIPQGANLAGSDSGNGMRTGTSRVYSGAFRAYDVAHSIAVV